MSFAAPMAGWRPARIRSANTHPGKHFRGCAVLIAGPTVRHDKERYGYERHQLAQVTSDPGGGRPHPGRGSGRLHGGRRWREHAELAPDADPGEHARPEPELGRLGRLRWIVPAA